MMLDLSLYLCPSSPISAYTLNSGELCYSMRDDKGYTRFIKNQHYETLWFDEYFILRGLDTSNLPNEVYAQFTGERYGAIWSKRFVNVGDYTTRNPDIRHYDANGKLLRTASGGVSYLHVVKHYDSLAFPETGQTVKDVVELTWTFDAQGKNIIERYWYARGLALVGFSYYGNPPLHTRYSGLTSVKPTFHPLPNFAEPVPPPVEKETNPMPNPYIPPPDTGARGLLAKIPGSFVNLREQPYTDAKDLGDLRVEQRVLYGTSPQAPGWAFTVRESDSLGGWVSLQGGTVKFAPELLPEPEPTPTPELPRWTKAQLAALKGASGVLLQLLAEVEGEGEPTNSGSTF